MTMLFLIFILISFCSSSVEGFKAGNGKVDDNFPFYTHKTITYDVLCGNEPIFDSDACRQIYFGDLLRDLSQLNDIGLRKKLKESQIVRSVQMLVEKEYGYKDQEYRVTAERLLIYRPEEHVDNPVYIAQSGTHQDVDSRFRGDLSPEELAISPTTSEKNYILPTVDGANQPSFMTILTHFRNSLTRAAKLMNESVHDIGVNAAKPLQLEAYMAYGAVLHALGDFFAHSNYVELALHEQGHNFDQVFPWVGRDTQVSCGTKQCYPLVTGHAVGGAELKIIVLGTVKQKLQSFLRKLSRRSLTSQLYPHLRKRFLKKFFNKVKEKATEAINAVKNLVGKTREPLLNGLKVVATPVVKIAHDIISERIEEATAQSDGSHIFTDPKDTNPLHSQVGKDNNDNPLHAVAAQAAMVAIRIVSKPSAELLTAIKLKQLSDEEVNKRILNIVNLAGRTLVHPSIGGTSESTQVMQVIKTWYADERNKNMINSGLIGFETTKLGRNRLF